MLLWHKVYRAMVAVWEALVTVWYLLLIVSSAVLILFLVAFTFSMAFELANRLVN
jgi:hypothetical protein